MPWFYSKMCHFSFITNVDITTHFTGDYGDDFEQNCNLLLKANK